MQLPGARIGDPAWTSVAWDEESASTAASLSGALAGVFRGKLCDAVFQDNPPQSFSKGTALYDAGDERRIFFFIRDGIVKVGRVAADGHEIIYDLRKAGEVVGELCIHETPRRERAVALEATQAIVVPYERIAQSLQQNGPALHQLLEAVCRALAGAYAHVDLLATRDTVGRLARVLSRLAEEIGRPCGDRIEIRAYLTQEEIAQMAAVSREKVSGWLNRLRERGVVRYSRGGHLLVDVEALKKYQA